MQKREKIIVALAVIAAIYAVIDFTLIRHKKQARLAPSVKAESVAITPSSAEITALFSPDTAKIDRIAASLNDSWPENVFNAAQTEYEGEQAVDSSRDLALKELAAKVSQFYYTGYVSANDDTIAIINGMDYRVGEQIEGFTVTRITMDSVQVTANNTHFTIPAALDLPSADHPQE